MTDITPSRYTSEDSIDVTMPSLVDGTYSVGVTNSTGAGSGSFQVGAPPPSGGDITRTVHDLDRLYYMVKVERTDGLEWNNITGVLPDTTNVFRICSIANTSYYGNSPIPASVVDWGLDLNSIDNSFSGLPFVKPLAKIPQVNFSIDNLEMIYHKLCENNGGDLNTFQSAQVEVYKCNGLIPACFWDSGSNLWRNEEGAVWTLNPPANPPAEYPTNDSATLIFKGLITKPNFSVKRTSFTAMGISEKSNTKIGTLAGAQADTKNRGDIIPITYGNWGQEGDLAPVILEGEQVEVPRLVIGERPSKEFYSARLYDKVSELDYRALGDVNPNDDNTKVSFTDPTEVAELQANVTDDPTDWKNGGQLDSVINSHFPNQENQLTVEIDEEKIAFHDDLSDFTGENSAASRQWGGSQIEAHTPDDDVFEVDPVQIKAKATIKIPLRPSDFYLDSKVGGTYVSSGGSFSQTLLNTDFSLDDQDRSEYFYRMGAPKEQPLVDSNLGFQLKFKESGFNEVVKNYTYKLSFTSHAQAGIDWFNPPSPVVSSNILTVSTNDQGYPFGLNNYFEDTTVEWDFNQFEVTETNTAEATFNELVLGLTYNIWLIPDLAGQPELTEDFWLSLNYFEGEATIEVYAENGTWFWRGLGRENLGGDLIEKPVEILEDLAEFELLSQNTIINNATNRDDWKAAPSLFGKQMQFRKWLDKYLLNCGAASYSNAAGEQVVFDMEKKVTPDFSIFQSDILDDNGVQALSYDFTGRDNLYNEFVIKFRKNPANNQFLNVLTVNSTTDDSTEPWVFFTDRSGLKSKCETATKGLGFNNGEIKQFVFEAESIRDQRTAEQLLQFFINFHHNTTALVDVKLVTTKAGSFEIGQQVDFNDVQGIPSKIKQAQYIIIGKRENPTINGKQGSIDLKLMEVQF